MRSRLTSLELERSISHCSSLYLRENECVPKHSSPIIPSDLVSRLADVHIVDREVIFSSVIIDRDLDKLQLERVVYSLHSTE